MVHGNNVHSLKCFCVEQKSLLETVRIFSPNEGMELDIEICATMVMNKRKMETISEETEFYFQELM